MTKKYSFKKYAPSLSDKLTAEKIYNEISALDLKGNEVEIDLSDMMAMTTICARIIFGKLYITLGKILFSQHVKVFGASETLRIVINWGIESAIENHDID